MTVDQTAKSSRLRSIRLPILIVSVTLAIIFLLIATRPRMRPVPVPERVWPVEVIEAQWRYCQERRAVGADRSV